MKDKLETRPGRPEEIRPPPARGESTAIRPLPRGAYRPFAAALQFLEGLSPALLLAISVVLVGLIGIATYATEVELRFSFFYLLPIALSAWFVGRSAGIFLALASAAAWTVEYLLEHRLESTGRTTAFENAPLLLGFFLVLSLLLSTLRRALSRETDAARLDSLTGIANRRAFFELAEGEFRRMARYGGRLTVAYVDLDDFKAVNDRDGHEAGDRLLQVVAKTIRGDLRISDIVARLGGDEFVILLPETGATEADAVLGKIRRRLEDSLRTEKCAVTASVGCVTFERPPESVDGMVRLADELMYLVKTSGKNRIAKRVIGEEQEPSRL